MTGDSVLSQISDGLSVMRALERVLSPTPLWADLGFPVIDRVKYAIFPLAVAPVQEGGDFRKAKRLSEMEESLRSACIHFYEGDSFHAEMVLDIEDGYGRRLVDAGAIVPRPTWLYWWGIRGLAAVLVRSIDQERELETLALHAIPKDWVWYSPINSGTKREASRYRRIVRDRGAADVADVFWSWPLADPDE